MHCWKGPVEKSLHNPSQLINTENPSHPIGTIWQTCSFPTNRPSSASGIFFPLVPLGSSHTLTKVQLGSSGLPFPIQPGKSDPSHPSLRSLQLLRNFTSLCHQVGPVPPHHIASPHSSDTFLSSHQLDSATPHPEGSPYPL